MRGIQRVLARTALGFGRPSAEMRDQVEARL